MLRSYLAVAGCTAAALLSFAFAGCGSETVQPPADQTGRVPPEPGPAKPADGPGQVYAVSKLFLGETNRDGTQNKANGWKQYGYNLDGRISTTASTDVCKPNAGAAPSVPYPDGDQGIDNSFGKNILPTILGLEPAPSTSITDSINEGSFTVMLSLEGLGPDPDYNPMTTQLYGGADLGAPPAWDGNDMWPVIPELLAGDMTDITRSQVVFPESYLVGNTWVSGSKGTVTLNLAIQGYSLSLTIAAALISMDLNESHAEATNGTIAGVLETEVLITELQKVVGGFQPSLCEGPTIEGILNQIRQASDIMKDGTQNPNATCDGISIGIGFEALPVQLGAIAPPAPPSPDPCAGTGGGGTGGGGTGGAGGGP
jgi:hypothetical protein